MAIDTTIGGASSDSYGTLAAYQAYATSEGWALADMDAENEVNLRKAARHIDRGYSFVGIRQYQVQARAWPRLVGNLVNDWPVNPDTIPADIIYAQFELAYLMQGGLNPSATIATTTTSESIKVGPITISEDTLPTAKPRIVVLEGLLRPYLTAGAGQIALARG
ncbi:MAG: DnaT-like ssDNA-binding protein [Paracoccaceae bacterium]